MELARIDSRPQVGGSNGNGSHVGIVLGEAGQFAKRQGHFHLGPKAMVAEFRILAGVYGRFNPGIGGVLFELGADIDELHACLDGVALSLQHSSDAELALVGNSDASEKAPMKPVKSSVATAVMTEAAKRALETKTYLVKEKGIDSSRVKVYAGSSDSRTVDMTLIPSGATLDTTGLTLLAKP